MRVLRAVLIVLLAACRNPDDPGYAIVRVPSAAYGPFDAAAPSSAAPDAGAPIVHARAIASCVEPDGPPKRPADAPFDNCEEAVGRRALDVRSTARTRRSHPDACCYVREPPSKRRIVIDESE